MVTALAALPWLSGTDPAYTVLRARAGDQIATADALSRIRAELDLTTSPLEQIQRWLGGLARGDLGRSWVSRTPVRPQVLDALRVSLTLMIASMVVALVIAVPLVAPAIRSAVRGTQRRTGGAVAAALTALPEFVLASTLVVVGAVWLGWFPPYGWGDLSQMVMPALAFGLPAGGYLGRLLADGITEVGAQPWVATWAVAGVPRRRVGSAIVRAASVGLLPQVALVLISLTGGALAVERVFAIPGLGQLTLAAASAQDLPMLQAGVLSLLAVGAVFATAAGVARHLVVGAAQRTASVSLADEHPFGRRAGVVVASIAAAGLAVIVGVGLLRDPFAVVHERLERPSASLPFGADASGRDVLARVGHGAAATIGTALVIVLACYALGMLAGLAPRLSAGPIDVSAACPPMVVGAAVAGLMGPSRMGAAVAVFAVGWAPLGAHAASLAADARAQPHVRILPLLGTGRARVLLHHVVPVIALPVLRHALLRLPGVALSLAALGFLGLGPQPPAPDWGLVLAEGTPYLERAPWAVLAPSASIVLLSVLAVALGAATAGSRRAQ